MTSLLCISSLSAQTPTSADDLSSTSSAEITKLTRSPFAGIKVIEERLSNGLTLIMSPDHRLPTVAVEVRYLVGSGHEREGRSGFAHLFEHLMFQGSKSYDDEYFKPFTPMGGRVNGTTNTDRTNYYEQIPSEALEVALWMESDRMEGLLEVLTQKKLDNQRDVVKNERRQRYENTPYGMVWKIFSNELYPKGHPYQHTTIGSHEDLTAATLDDVKAFFKKYYVPANAILTITGDFDPKETRAMVQRYFGHLPAGQRASKPKAQMPTLMTERTLTIKDKIKLPRVYLAWHTPALYKEGDAAMDLLATILSDGKTSRLYQPLVYEKKVAKDVSAYQVSHALSSYFVVSATVAPGHTIEEVSTLLSQTLKSALKTPPTQDEFMRALNGWRKSFYHRVEGVMSRAQLLSTYHHLMGRAKGLEIDLNRYTSLTPQAVYKTSHQWIDRPPLRVHFIPEEDEKMTPPNREELPKLKESKEWSPPQVNTWTTAQGLEVWHVQQDQAPLISLQLIIDGGASTDPKGKAGLTALMVDLMDEGAGERDALELSDAFQRLAVDYSGGVGTDGVTFSLDVLAEELNPSLEIFKDILTKPRLNQADFERIRKQRLANILAREANPRSTRNIVMRRVLFREGYGGWPSDGVASTLKKFTLADVKSQYQAQIQPKGATLIVVGAIDQESLKGVLKQIFNGWKGSPNLKRLPLDLNQDSTAIHWVDFPESTQSAIALARPIKGTGDVEHPFDDQLFNRVLGGEFTSRINMNLRENKGYTYGAYSGLYRFQRSGMFFIGAMVKGDTTYPSIKEIWAELDGVKKDKPITTDELEKVRGGLLKGFPVRFEKLSGIAHVLGELRSKHRTPQWLKDWLKGVAAVILKGTNNSAQTLGDRGALQIIIAGDRSKHLADFKALKLPIYFYNARAEPIQPSPSEKTSKGDSKKTSK